MRIQTCNNEMFYHFVFRTDEILSKKDIKMEINDVELSKYINICVFLSIKNRGCEILTEMLNFIHNFFAF